MATVIGHSAQAVLEQVPLQAEPPQAVSLHWPPEVLLAQAAAAGQLPPSWHAVDWLHVEPVAHAEVAFGQPWQALVATVPLAGQLPPSSPHALAHVPPVLVAFGHDFAGSSAQPTNTAAEIPATSTRLVISVFICTSP
jgi:hypothetical protein